MANSKLGPVRPSATQAFRPWILGSICLSAAAILASCSFFTRDKDLVLVASVKYEPMRWLDAQYNPGKAFGFKIAANAQVVLGNAGNQYATLSWVTPDGKQGMCRYKGGSSQIKPTSKKELEKAKYYNLDNCTDNLKANAVVSARMLTFHIDNGGNSGKHQETAAAIKVGITSAPAPTPTPTITPTTTPTATPEPSPVPTASPSPAPTPLWQSQGWSGDGAAPSTVPGTTPLNPQVNTHIGSSVSFLYQGAAAPQKDVDPNSINVLRAGVVRGFVKDGNKAALAGVKVSILGRPDLGYTLSRADGGFDFVVNGGSDYTLVFTKAQYFEVQRDFSARENDFVFSADAHLVAQSAVSTLVQAASASLQVARGDAISDKDGARQATLLLPPGTTMEAVKLDGSRVTMNTATLRITEFTVGTNGPARMPAVLPANSGYTYAAEFSVDEGISLGAQSVEFSQPLPVYLDNFLNFPVESRVPSGYYDRMRGEWIPSEDGIVVKILAISGGTAELSMRANGTAMTAEEKAGLGVSTAELQKLASLYPVGKTLWRMRISHFTPWDFNLPIFIRPPDGASQPPEAKPKCSEGGNGSACQPDSKPASKPEVQCGSILECENQIVREQVELAGTGAFLSYSSQEQEGFTNPYTVRIPITGPLGTPTQAKSTEVEIKIMGRRFVQNLPALGPNAFLNFTWDGLDAYGRRAEGTFNLVASVAVYFDAEYLLQGNICFEWETGCVRVLSTNSTFAQSVGSGADPLLLSPTSRATRNFGKVHKFKVGVSRAGKNAAALGGWRLSAHHAYDFSAPELLKGDGTRFSTQGLSTKVQKIFGRNLPAGAGLCSGIYGFKEGVDAADMCVPLVTSSEIDADGNLLVKVNGAFSDSNGSPSGNYVDRIFKINAANKVSLVISATEVNGDAGVQPHHLILGPKGRILSYDNFSGKTCFTEHMGGGQFTPLLGDCSQSLPDTTVIDDGMLATQFPFVGSGPRDIAFDPSGNIYIRTYVPGAPDARPGDLNSFVKIDSRGRAFLVRTLAQTSANKGLFEEVYVNNYSDFPAKVSSDGTIYFSFRPNIYNGNRPCLAKISPIGQLEGVLGRCGSTGGGRDLGNSHITDGTPGSGISAFDLGLGAFYIDSESELYFVSARSGGVAVGVYKLNSQGFIFKFLYAPSSTEIRGESVLNLNQVPQPFQEIVEISNKRIIFRSYGGDIYQSFNTFPGFNAGDLNILNEGARTGERFSAYGRHLGTRDFMLGQDLLNLNYTPDGLLSSMRDENARTLSIERDANGVPLRIVAPNGEISELVLDTAGRLAGVNLPGGRQYKFQYTSSGLVTRFENPRSLASTYTFETDGRLAAATRADTGVQSYVRTESDTGSRVSRTSPTGRVSAYDLLASNTKKITSPTGAVTTIQRFEGKNSTTLPDGSISIENYVGDPRSLAGAQVLSQSTQTLPLGQVRSESFEHSYAGSAAGEPESFTNYALRSSVNGRSSNVQFDKALRTWTSASPASRNSQSVLTPKGQVSSATPHTGLIVPAALAYDVLGRLTNSVQGNLSASFTYDALDRVTSAQNAAGEVSQYEYDAASRVTAMVSPEGKRALFTYDANNNVTSVKLPSGSTHTQGYSVTDLHTAYASPSAIQDLGKAYNLEQELTRLTLLGTGRVFDVTRDGGGRVTSSASAESTQAFTYADATGRVANATNTQGSNSQVSQFTYNGPLLTAFSTSGVANSVFTYTFDNDFWVSNIVFDNGAVTLPIVRDGDGLMTQYSDFTLDRSGPLGAPISIIQGNGQWQKSYDNLGRLQSEALKVSGNVKLQFDYAYNTAGRLISRIETESTGNIRTVLFTYDRDGQLLEVSENGVSTETNAYDVNGNRTSRKVGTNTRAANYDAKDRLIAQANVNYVFDADGFLKSRGADTFTYGTRGELLSANVGGVAVSYVYDTQVRLVARTQGSSKIEYLYGNLSEPFQLTAVKEAGVLKYNHYDPSGRLMAFDRGGVRYFVQTDQVGTPRVVTDAAGNVVKQIRTSAFGEVLSDTAPAFKIYVGYAGGISDSSTGLIRFGFRDYEPLSGRWTARDPILFQGGQGNLYVYVGNSVIGGIDPSGLSDVVFSRQRGTLEIWPDNGMGPPQIFPAHNNTIRPNNHPWGDNGFGPAPNGIFSVEDFKPKSGGSNGMYGPGIFIFHVQPDEMGPANRPGIGIHSGRANKPFAKRKTLGCIRTTDDAMDALLKDPPNWITIGD